MKLTTHTSAHEAGPKGGYVSAAFGKDIVPPLLTDRSL